MRQGLKSIGRYKTMEKIINSYETLFVIDPDLTEEATKALVAKFTKLISDNGEIVEANEWGKRKLAYPINDKTDEMCKRDSNNIILNGSCTII